MSRLYVRTSKNTGVSLGCFATLIVGFLALAVIAAPVTLLANLLGLGSSPVAAVVMVVWIVVVLGWISERRGRR
ncbi:MAG: hypothetical protein ACR2IP_08230 [Solirubrobacteraceae bacterium]